VTTRREFVQHVGAALPVAAAAPSLRTTLAHMPNAAGTFVDLNRSPDSIEVQTASGYVTLAAGVNGRWEGARLIVTCTVASGVARITLAAPADEIRRIRIRWTADLQHVRLLLGDAWERAYGDLEWRGMAPDRTMPWYAATWDGRETHGYGVRTGAAAFCWWQVDPAGITCWADVRSGGSALQLGDRELAVCDIVSRQGRSGESAFNAIRSLCHLMSPAPRLPALPVYGHNDWYYAYGHNSEATVLADVAHLVELSPTGSNRPFAVIDDGWQPERGSVGSSARGLWDRGNEKFPDMAALAAKIVTGGARPGIWTRPLLATADARDSWRLSRSRATFDPTVAGVQEKVHADIARLREWGYQLIKHDYSTYDIMGRWGRTMGTALTTDGWRFASGSARTTAEVIGDFYRVIRAAAGGSLVIGCNTVSHLSAGLFEICRIGDDTSGAEWQRVPEMGVNALAFRGAQHGAFYVADPDCVGVTTSIPWQLNRQWLDLLARSGTTLFVSLAPDALTPETKRDLKAALAIAAVRQPLAEPLDWQGTIWPTHWREANHDVTYQWTTADGLPPAT
jgi:alpha-galactosidase